MTGATIAAGSRLMTAALSVVGGAFFGFMAIEQPVWFLASGAPVDPSWAFHAWAGPLAGLPMAGLAYFGLAIIVRAPMGQSDREALVARSLQAGLWGLGLGALLSAAALAGALLMQGVSPVHAEGAGMVVPMIGVLAGLAIVVCVGLVRMVAGGAWTALGHILWGFLGVVALAVGLPMLADAVTVDDGRTLIQRYNLLIVFYPVLWLAFAAMAVAATICGVRWVRFGLSAQQRNEVIPPSTDDAWPATYSDSLEIRKKAA